MATKRVDFIAHAYIDTDAIPDRMPLETVLSTQLSNPVVGVVHVRDAEEDKCTCCTYDCGQRRISREAA